MQYFGSISRGRGHPASPQWSTVNWALNDRLHRGELEDTVRGGLVGELPVRS